MISDFFLRAEKRKKKLGQQFPGFSTIAAVEGGRTSSLSSHDDHICLTLVIPTHFLCRSAAWTRNTLQNSALYRPSENSESKCVGKWWHFSRTEFVLPFLLQEREEIVVLLDPTHGRISPEKLVGKIEISFVGYCAPPSPLLLCVCNSLFLFSHALI